MVKLVQGRVHYLTQHHSGNGRGLSTGKLLPPDWRLVRVTVQRITGNKITLVIEPVVKE